jgi:hypothetical protein
MSRSFKHLPVLTLGVLLFAARPAAAQLLYEDFESYNLGVLDKNNGIFGDNYSDNGVGNPWFGPSPPNCYVVNAENDINGNLVNPISGTQMVRGSTIPADFDQDWYNIAYRLNMGAPFTQNLVMDWWFYDQLGAGGTDYKDYIALAFYDTAPPNTDGPIYGTSDDYNLNIGVINVQRLSVGGTGNQDPGFDPNFYQARIVGRKIVDGAYNDNGWYNTQTPRSVGWHHAAIVVGPLNADGSSDVLFFCDDMTTPTLQGNIPAAFNYGFNVIEINANFGAVTAYFDDITFDVTGT